MPVPGPDHERRVVEDVNTSKPVDTTSGNQILTQVVNAIENLKTKDNPISFDQIWNYLSVPAQQQHHRKVLQRALIEHPNVEYDPDSLDGHAGFRFRPVHNIRSADDLKKYLQHQSTAHGVNVQELKDGWPTAIADIEALQNKGELLVTRRTKDNVPKVVWLDDHSLATHVDQDFRDYWRGIELPANPSDMRMELVEAGLNPTTQAEQIVNVEGSRSKKKITRNTGKSTNTHMSGILKEYSWLSK